MSNPSSPRLARSGRSTRLLNIGCGDAVHPEWVNLDSSAADPRVIRHDLRRGLPFGDGSMDVIYGSHVLEHLDLDEGARLLRECNRVVIPGGIVRVVVPDLEAIVKVYLESLAAAAAGDSEAAYRYDWAMLELYDQSVRTVSGGRMASFLQSSLRDHEVRFVESRIGREAVRMARGESLIHPASFGRRLVRRVGSAVTVLRASAARACAWLVLGSEGASALREGLFRRSGEVHQHMYDRFSLKRAMERAGFTELTVCEAGASRIPDFERYELEVRDGCPRKPDSLYMEGCKAGAS